MTARKKSEGAIVAPVVVPAEKASFSLISDEKLLALYRAMLQCRLIVERNQPLVSQESLAILGQEAAMAGITIDLLAGDFLVSSRLRLLAKVIQGAPIATVLGQIFGHPTAFEKAPAAQPSVAQLHHALGVALTYKTRGNGKIAVVFSGSGDASIAWQEALYIAGVQDLPMIFVAQNLRESTFPAETTTAKRKKTVSDSPVDCLPVIPVEGSDVVAVYRVATESITRARAGRGPTRIDCLRFSPDGIVRDQDSDDSILKMEQYLTRKELFCPHWKEEVVASFGKELDRVVAPARGLSSQE